MGDDARRRLFALLANADRYPVPEGDLATLEYLIAESYFLQGSQRQEDAR